MGDFYNNITISDDLSAGNMIQDRNLHALKEVADQLEVMLPPGTMPLGGTMAMQSDMDSQDYQMQLRLLEQQGKKRAARGQPTLPTVYRYPAGSTQGYPSLGYSSQGYPPQNYQLQDYHEQLMLLEQQNKKRLLLARQEQDPSRKDVAHAASPIDDTMAAVVGSEASPGRMTPTTDSSRGDDLSMVETELRKALATVHAPPQMLQKWQDYVGLLRLHSHPAEVGTRPQTPSRHQILYRIQKEGNDAAMSSPDWLKSSYLLPYFDHPEWTRGEGNARRLHGKMPLTNYDLYLERNKDVVFLVYRNFDQDVAQAGADGTGSQPATQVPQHTSESIRPVSPDLIEAVKVFLRSRPEYADMLHEYLASKEVRAPYLFIYHSRHSLQGVYESLLRPGQADQLSLLCNYVLEQYAHEYAAADNLLSQHKISPDYVHYLFKPGDVLVSRDDGHYTGFIATSWPQLSRSKEETPEALHRMPLDEAKETYRSTMSKILPVSHSQSDATKAGTDRSKIQVCNINAWHWAFDGNFQREHTRLRLEIPVVQDEVMSNGEGGQGKKRKPGLTGTNLSDLNVIPIRYASSDVVEKCRRRGKTFWKCRHRRLVTYHDSETDSVQNLVSSIMNDPPSPELLISTKLPIGKRAIYG